MVANACSRCQQALRPHSSHAQHGDCEPAAVEADNPHALTRGELRLYPEALRPLVLAHGRQKFGLAFALAQSNAGMNQILRVAHNLRHLRQPADAVIHQLDYLASALCFLHEWSMQEDILPLVQEILRATSSAAAKRIIIAGAGSA